VRLTGRTTRFRRQPVLIRFRDDRPKDRAAYFLPSPSGDRLTFSLPDVEVFRAGNYRGRSYSVADLDDMVRNFRRLHGLVRPTAVIGHEEYQPLTAGLRGAGQSFRDRYATSLSNTGIPAVGWVIGLRRKGLALHADFDRVPRVVRDLILAGAYATVSSEVYHRPPEGCTHLARGKVLRRVAFLGGELPHLKSLPEVAALYSDDAYDAYFAAHDVPRRLASVRTSPVSAALVRTGRDDYYACFSEATPMPVERKAIEDLLKKMNCYTPAMADDKVYTDEALFDQIGFHVENLATDGMGQGGGGEGGDAYADLSHDDLVAKVMELDPNQDQAQVTAMSDDDLRGLLGELEDEQVPAKHNDRRPPRRGRPDDDLMDRFSEMLEEGLGEFRKESKKTLAEMTALAERSKKANEESAKSAADRDRENHRAACFAELESLADAGKVERSELEDDPKDPSNPGLKTIAASLDYKTPVATYKDAQGAERSLTSYDQFMNKFRKRTVSESERLRQPPAEQFADTEMASAKKEAEEYAKDMNSRLAADRVN
jgi:hypothetical protein